MTNKEKLERLVEAGKKATQDDWRMMINSSKGRSVRSTGGMLFNAWKPNHYPGQDARYDRELEETKSNCEFITQAANSRQAIEEMLAENERLREALNTILTASEFYTQEGIAGYVMRYTHENTARLAKQALGESE